MARLMKMMNEIDKNVIHDHEQGYLPPNASSCDASPLCSISPLTVPDVDGPMIWQCSLVRSQHAYEVLMESMPCIRVKSGCATLHSFQVASLLPFHLMFYTKPTSYPLHHVNAIAMPANPSKEQRPHIKTPSIKFISKVQKAPASLSSPCPDSPP